MLRGGRSQTAAVFVAKRCTHPVTQNGRVSKWVWVLSEEGRVHGQLPDGGTRDVSIPKGLPGDFRYRNTGKEFLQSWTRWLM